MASLRDAIRLLRAAEPELGVKAIVRRLAAEHPDIDARAVREALVDAVEPEKQPESGLNTPELPTLEPAPPAAVEPPPPAFDDDDDDDDSDITPLRTVELHGLSAESLNGARGCCVLRDPDTGRLAVQLVSPQKGRAVKIKPANLKPSAHPDWPVFGRLERGDPLSTTNAKMPRGAGGRRTKESDYSHVAVQMYRQIMSGEHLQLQLIHNPAPKVFGTLIVTVLPEAGIPGTDQQRSHRLEVVDMGRGMVFAQSGKDDDHLTNVAKPMADALEMRAMHLALRSFDIELPPSLMRSMFSNQLVQQYRHYQEYDKLVDVFALQMDEAIAGVRVTPGGGQQMGSATAVMMAQLGEALEARGEFLYASEVYIEAARSREASDDAAVILLANGALAAKRGGNLEAAEAYNHQSLRMTLAKIAKRTDLRKLRMVPSEVTGTLCNLVMVYAEMGEFIMTDKESATPEELMKAVHSGELSTAKLEVMKLEKVVELLMFIGGAELDRGSRQQKQQDASRILLPHCQNADGAMAGLLGGAILSPDVASFRKNLLRCADANKVVIHASLEGGEKGLRKSEQHYAKVDARLNAARRPGANMHAEDEIRMECGGCGNEWDPNPHAEKFPKGFPLCARCATVAYCSVGCQKAHWKQKHKYECKECADDKSCDAAAALQRLNLTPTVAPAPPPTLAASAPVPAPKVGTAGAAPAAAPAFVADAPAVITLEIVIPMGYVPGSKLTCRGPDGAAYTTTVPDGAVVGSKVQFKVPKWSGPPAAAASSFPFGSVAPAPANFAFGASEQPPAPTFDASEPAPAATPSEGGFSLGAAPSANRSVRKYKRPTKK